MQQLIEDSLTYDPDTGMFKWLDTEGRKNCAKKRGWFYGFLDERGYRVISINKKPIRAHRLAWYLMKGEMPPRGLVIDHIDRNPSNNKLDNLRVVTHGENVRNSDRVDNSKLALQGVSGRWYAYNYYKGKRTHLGTFDTEEEATEKARHVKLNNRYRDEQQA
tara:strand:- start:18 stop:503 length:486 start_codon:yes stop_codon:yes gene_type:complete